MPGMEVPLDIPVIEVRLPRPLRAVTDGMTIWLHEHLSHRERRVSVCHELVHVWLRHTTHQADRIEFNIDLAVSRWLLPDLDAVVDCLAAADMNADVAADDLAVTPRTLTLRLEHLLPYEERHVNERFLNLHP